ncbi:MAG: hypothetical protein Q8N36_02435 [bacterium]|nr:hypothetical protein [bacterium]
MIVCPNCKEPTKPAHKKLADGKSVRVCKHCAENIDK